MKLKPFREWAEDLRRLPSPALLHPVAFQAGGHDESDPDFLPPDPRWGTSAEFASVVEAAHALEQLVMPYLNVSWWSDDSPTMRTLPSPLRPSDIAVIDEKGRPVVDAYGPKSGIVVSPRVPFVRSRVARLMQEWRTDVPADWDAPVPDTGVRVFAELAGPLAQGFRGADRLYGYARHIVETTFVATSNGTFSSARFSASTWWTRSP